MHGNSLVHSQGVPPQPPQPGRNNTFKAIPTLYYCIRNNPSGVYNFLKAHNIHVDKNNNSLYAGVKNYVRHANQQDVLGCIQAVHPDKKYFLNGNNAPEANGSPLKANNSPLKAKIAGWEAEKESTNDPDVKKILDDLISKAKDLTDKGKGTVEDLIGEFKGAKKDSDFYKQVSIIAVVVIVLLIITRK